MPAMLVTATPLHFGAKLMTPEPLPVRCVLNGRRGYVPGQVWQIEPTDAPALLGILDRWQGDYVDEFSATLDVVIKPGKRKYIPAIFALTVGGEKMKDAPSYVQGALVGLLSYERLPKHKIADLYIETAPWNRRNKKNCPAYPSKSKSYRFPDILSPMLLGVFQQIQPTKVQFTVPRIPTMRHYRSLFSMLVPISKSDKTMFRVTTNDWGDAQIIRITTSGILQGIQALTANLCQQVQFFDDQMAQSLARISNEVGEPRSLIATENSLQSPSGKS